MTIAEQRIAPTRRDLVLIHGWGLHGGIWRDVADGLNAGGAIAYPDLPGHGGNQAPVPSALDDWARTIADGRDSAIWIGWSLGALVALRAADLVPTAIRALILIAATPRFVQAEDWPDAMAPATLSQFATGLGDDYVRTLSRFIALQFGSSAPERDAARRLRHAMMAQPPRSEGLQAGLKILQHTDLRSSLASIKVPVLVIHGEHDRLASPKAGAYIAAHVPHGEFALVPGAGHAPFLSHRRDVQRLITKFIDRQV